MIKLKTIKNIFWFIVLVVVFFIEITPKKLVVVIALLLIGFTIGANANEPDPPTFQIEEKIIQSGDKCLVYNTETKTWEWVKNNVIVDLWGINLIEEECEQ